MTFNYKTLLSALAATLVLAACASQPASAPVSEPVAEPEPVYEIEPWDGDGLDIPLDGSSMEAWNQSMARVEAHTSENSFRTLSNSIDYLKFYDLSVGQSMEKLIIRLDGQTGRQIIDRVAWQRFNPGRKNVKPQAPDTTNT